MKKILVCIFGFLFSSLLASPLYGNDLIQLNGIFYVSSGKYYVEEIGNDVFLKTENDGVLRMDGDDLSLFKPGESGIYYIEKQAPRPYILTDRKRTFYISDQSVLERIKQESLGEEETGGATKPAVKDRYRRVTNEKDERDMEVFRKELENKAALEKVIKAQKQAQERELKTMREAQERAIEADRAAQERAFEMELIKQKKAKRPIVVTPPPVVIHP